MDSDPSWQGASILPEHKWSESEGLQPSGLLNTNAMDGSFSLKSILSAPKSLPSGTGLQRRNSALEGASTPSDDPVSLGIVNTAIARSLFERWYTFKSRGLVLPCN